ncbi:hypothetical protein [Streptomyces sp. NPDC001404]|uniref:hypothetical protein n=1 Tax=Streptomyces sp. NPDC001404 TaxID=3364571 RepID=UPI0036A8ADEB
MDGTEGIASDLRVIARSVWSNGPMDVEWPGPKQRECLEDELSAACRRVTVTTTARDGP